jgi:hypothetical protein
VFQLLGVVTAVAHGLFARRFAAAKKYPGVFSRIVAHRCEAGVFVRAVAKGLACAQAAGAPEVGFAGLNRNTERAVSGTFWFVHNDVPVFCDICWNIRCDVICASLCAIICDSR